MVGVVEEWVKGGINTWMCQNLGHAYSIGKQPRAQGRVKARLGLRHKGAKVPT